MPRREDHTDTVTGRFTKLHFSRKGLRVTLTHPTWYFWAVIPGMSRAGKHDDSKEFFLPNMYDFDKFIEMLRSLPLQDERYQFDYDTTYTQMSSTLQYRYRCGRGTGDYPITTYAHHPNNGKYSPLVQVPKNTMALSTLPLA